MKQSQRPLLRSNESTAAASHLQPLKPRRRHLVTYRGRELQLEQLLAADVCSDDEQWNHVTMSMLCAAGNDRLFWLTYRHRIGRNELPAIHVVPMSATDRVAWRTRHPQLFTRRAA